MGKHFDHFLISEQESDIWIGFPADSVDSELIKDLKYHLVTQRSILRAYLEKHPVFESALRPYHNDPKAPEFISKMIQAGQAAQVGPMAAVAGAFCFVLANFLKELDIKTFIIENGGDLLVTGFPEVTIGVYAGEQSSFSNNLAIKIDTNMKTYGICSSSGMFGHSFSYGQADLVTVISEDIFTADAYATAMANQITNAADIDRVIKMTEKATNISGALMIKDETMGVFGNMELIEI